MQNETETRDWIQAIQAFNSYFIPEELERCFKNILKTFCGNTTAYTYRKPYPSI